MNKIIQIRLAKLLLQKVPELAANIAVNKNYTMGEGTEIDAPRIKQQQID